MLKKIIPALFLAAAVNSQAQWYRLDVDTQRPDEKHIIPATFEGNTPFIKAGIYEDGAVPILSNNWAMSLWYSKDQDTATGYQINGSFTSNNVVEFKGATNVFSRSGKYYFSIVGIHTAGYVKTFGRGQLYQEYDPGSDTNLQSIIAGVNAGWWTNNVGIQVASNTAAIVVNTANIAANDTDIATLQGRVTTNETNITSLQSQVTSNDTDIAAMLLRIASNEVNIVSNKLVAGTGLVITNQTPTNYIALSSASIASLALADSAVQDNDTGLTLGGVFTSTGTLDGYEGATLRQGVSETFGSGWDGDANTPQKTDIYAAADQTGTTANNSASYLATTKYVEEALTERGSSPGTNTYGASWQTNVTAAMQSNLFAVVIQQGTTTNDRSIYKIASTEYVEDAIELRVLSGAKAFTGDIDMGGNSITNIAASSVGFSDGVSFGSTDVGYWNNMTNILNGVWLTWVTNTFGGVSSISTTIGTNTFHLITGSSTSAPYAVLSVPNTFTGATNTFQHIDASSVTVTGDLLVGTTNIYAEIQTLFAINNTNALGATNITASSVDSFDPLSRTLTWNTNAAQFTETDPNWAVYSNRFVTGAGLLVALSVEQQSTFITNVSGTVYFETEKVGGGDLQFYSDNSLATLDCTTGAGIGGRARIALTSGTDSSPVVNWLYVTNQSGVAYLNKSATFPTTGQFSILGTVALKSAATTLAQGPYALQRWSDNVGPHASGSERGHVADIAARVRKIGAQHDEGCALVAQLVNAGTLYAGTESGYVYQLHRQAWTAKNTNGLTRWDVVNHWATNFTGYTNLAQITTTADAVAVPNNKWFALRLYGWQASGDDGVNRELISIGDSYYNTESQAKQDSDGYDNNSVPAFLRAGAFNLGRIILKKVTAGVELVEVQDTRGVPVYSSSGSGGSSGAESDPIWTAQSNSFLRLSGGTMTGILSLAPSATNTGFIAVGSPGGAGNRFGYLLGANGNYGSFTADPISATGVRITRLDNGPLMFGRNSNADFSAQTFEEQMRISVTGDIGIGTNSPAGKLHVFNGSSGAYTPAGSADELVLESSSDTGLTVVSADASSARMVFGSPSDQFGAQFVWQYSNDLFFFGPDKSTGEMSIRSGANTEAIRVDENQNVGIGTSTPSAALDVVGQLVVNGTNVMANLGGTSKPEEWLYVRHLTTDQTISHNTATVLNFTTLNMKTANMDFNTTSNIFTPTVIPGVTNYYMASLVTRQTTTEGEYRGNINVTGSVGSPAGQIASFFWGQQTAFGGIKAVLTFGCVSGSTDQVQFKLTHLNGNDVDFDSHTLWIEKIGDTQ